MCGNAPCERSTAFTVLSGWLFVNLLTMADDSRLLCDDSPLMLAIRCNIFFIGIRCIDLYRKITYICFPIVSTILLVSTFQKYSKRNSHDSRNTTRSNIAFGMSGQDVA